MQGLDLVHDRSNNFLGIDDAMVCPEMHAQYSSMCGAFCALNLLQVMQATGAPESCPD